MKNFAWIMIGIVAALAGVLLLLPEPGPETPATGQIEAVWKNGRPVDTARPAAMPDRKRQAFRTRAPSICSPRRTAGRPPNIR